MASIVGAKRGVRNGIPPVHVCQSGRESALKACAGAGPWALRTMFAESAWRGLCVAFPRATALERGIPFIMRMDRFTTLAQEALAAAQAMAVSRSHAEMSPLH